MSRSLSAMASRMYE